jgi:hypothetical protein
LKYSLLYYSIFFPKFVLSKSRVFLFLEFGGLGLWEEWKRDLSLSFEVKSSCESAVYAGSILACSVESNGRSRSESQGFELRARHSHVLIPILYSLCPLTSQPNLPSHFPFLKNLIIFPVPAHFLHAPPLLQN